MLIKLFHTKVMEFKILKNVKSVKNSQISKKYCQKRIKNTKKSNRKS